jgi:hypothetical protein
MKRTIRALPRTALAAALAAATFGAAAQSNSPWLPIPGGGSISASYVNQSGDSAYIGDRKLPISTITGGAAQRYKRESSGLKFSYGLADAVSVDANLSYAKTRVGAADNSSGLADSVIGVNWRVLDEFERRSLPTVTLRLSGIINGNYDGARLAALGKDASGYGVSVLVGRQFTPKFSLWGGLGFEHRANGVPNATFFDVNAAYAILPRLSLAAGYTNKQFGGDLDIGGRGFTPAAFQKVKEERETVRLGLSYAIASKQTVGLSFGKAVGGRNTVKDDSIIGVNYSFGF